MAATPSLQIVMQFTYRGSPQLFSNRYHFSGGTPASSAAWAAFVDDVLHRAVSGVRKGLIGAIPARVSLKRARGYAAGSDVAVYDAILSENGERSNTNFRASGDSAMMLRWSTAARTSKGHPIYLFSYIHGVDCVSADGDTVESGQRTGAQAYAERWWNAGFTDGTNTYKRAGPNGATATDSEVDPYIRHRDFPT